MYKTIDMIALRTVRYSDSRGILWAFSPDLGRLSLGVPFGEGRGARRLRALTAPMCTFTAEVALRGAGPATGGVVNMRDVRPLGVPLDLTGRPAATMTATFMADVLCGVTHESDGDRGIWQVAQESVRLLGQLRGRMLADVNLWFLRALVEVLGVCPDVGRWHRAALLDLREGRFVTVRPLHADVLEADDARLVAFWLRHGRDAMGRLPLRGEVRSRIVRGAVDYLRLHQVLASPLRSLDVLESLF